jgi:hypothetical protein
MEVAGRQQKYSYRNLSLSLYHFVYHKSHSECPEIEPGLKR